MAELKKCRGCRLDVQTNASFALPIKFWVALLTLSVLALLPMPAQTERVRLEWKGSSQPDYARGAMQHVTVVSNVAYVGADAALVIFDVSNPTNPALLGGDTITGFVHSVVVAGAYAYVAAHGSWDGFKFLNAMEVLDVSDPAQPMLVGSYDAGASVTDVQVVGSRAYVVSGGTWTGSNFIGALEILDVGDPSQPVLLGSITTVSALRVQMAGNFAYVAANQSIDVIDVSNSAAPRRVGTYASGQSTEGFRVAGHYGYLAGERWTGSNWVGNLEIVDLNNPTNLVRVGTYDTSGYAHDVHLVGTRAYLAGGVRWTGPHEVGWAGTQEVGNTLEVLDVTDPAAAVFLGSYRTPAPAVSVQVAGDYAYLASGSAGLQVIDIRNPANLTRSGDFDATAYALGVQVVGHYAYVTGWRWSDASPLHTNTIPGTLEVFDVSNPTKPERVGRYDLREQSRVHVVGNYAYLAEGTWQTGTNDPGALEIIDVSNPTNLVRVGGIATQGRAQSVQVVGNYAYVPESARWTGSNALGALSIFDVSNPLVPVLAGRFETNGDFYDVRVAGNYAYAAGGNADLLVFDVSNPSSPALVGSYSTNVDNPRTGRPGGPSVDIEVIGNYAYAAGPDGLHVLDVSSPINPVRISGFGIGLIGIHVAGKYAFAFSFAAHGLSGPTGFLAVLDVSNPADMVLVSGDDPGTSWIASEIQVVSNRVYVAAGTAGFLIFEIQVIQVPSITAVSREGNTLIVSWPGAPGLKLQRTESLDDPVWTDVPESEGQGRIELPIGSEHEFFRLMLP